MESWGLDTMVFMGMAIGGAALLAILFLLGEVFGFGDHDADTDVDHDGGHEEYSFLNVRTVLGFICGLGATGWILTGYFSVSPVISSFVGVLGGFALAVPLSLIYRFLRSQSASSTFSTEELIDTLATVTLGIPANGVGRVQYEKRNSTYSAIARSQNSVGIPEGTVVRVARVIGEELYVSKE